MANNKPVDDSKDDIAGFMNELVQRQGVACTTTDDGHVIMFSTATLEGLLEKSKASGKAVIFIKRQDMS